MEKQALTHVIRNVSAMLIALVISGATVWATLALWYRLPAPELVKYTVCSISVMLGGIVVIFLFGQYRFRSVIIFAAAFGALHIWWSTIEPAFHGDWAADVARQVTGKLDGDTLILANVRNFDWRSDTDFTEHWTTRTYDLAKLRSLDLFMSYWAGPEMAHVMLSFGFEDGRYLAWSVEVRRTKGGEFSPIGDLFKSNPLVIIAAEERDVVGVRSNVRGEDVQIYRLRAAPEVARAILLEYVNDANALSTSPKFYNSLVTNCTTAVVKLMAAAGDKIPFDWRLIVNGYLPEYAYSRGALDGRSSLAKLRTLAHIDKRANKAGLTADYSRLIRMDVPSPHDE